MRTGLKAAVLLQILLVMLVGCATPGRTIVAGMITGAVVGAGVGYSLDANDNKRQQTQNTLVAAGVAAMLAGGLLAWHYQEVEKEMLKVSGRFSRYRLCQPEEIESFLRQQLTQGHVDTCADFSISPQQIVDSAIGLDDNTKWTFPQFRKRYLPPERDESKVISKRYLWEIIRPGSFVTRSQNPEFFSQQEK